MALPISGIDQADVVLTVLAGAEVHEFREVGKRLAQPAMPSVPAVYVRHAPWPVRPIKFLLAPGKGHRAGPACP